MNLRILMLTAFLCARTVLADLSGIITTSTQISPGYTQLGNAYWFAASAPYVNGGVTFTFPTDLFIQNPTVLVSLSTDNYSSTDDYSAFVTVIDPAFITVRVNTNTLISIAEAATDSVTLHVWAIGTAD
jgi:hypothetical protein